MRSCINTLQFLKEKSGKLTDKELLAKVVGSKDIVQGWRPVCKAVFEMPKANSSKLEKASFKKSDSKGSFTLRVPFLIDR